MQEPTQYHYGRNKDEIRQRNSKDNEQTGYNSLRKGEVARLSMMQQLRMD